MIHFKNILLSIKSTLRIFKNHGDNFANYSSNPKSFLLSFQKEKKIVFSKENEDRKANHKNILLNILTMFHCGKHVLLKYVAQNIKRTLSVFKNLNI